LAVKVTNPGKNLNLRPRGVHGMVAARALCVMLASGIALVGCGDSFVDSFNKTPPPGVVVQHPPHPTSNWIDSINPTDGTTSATLCVTGGWVSSTECSLYIFLKYCDGTTRIRLGTDSNSYTLTKGYLTDTPYCPDSTATFVHLTYVYSGLTPGKKYYLNIMGYWGIAQPWQLDGSFTTRPDSSLDTLSKRGP
jgi:hypothetical protein